MNDDEIFESLAHLVATGEYLDDMLGLPGVDLDGGGAFRGAVNRARWRRIYQRRSSRYLAAKASGWIEFYPPLEVATPAAVEEAEELAGVTLPPLLRRLYLEVGNGGFGPGYGLAGLRNGHHAGEATASLAGRRRSDVGPRIPMILCHWGCGITSTIDLADGQIWGSDPNPGPADVSCEFPQGMTISEWFALWLENRLYQPWLLEDDSTGQWRGATLEDYENMLATEG
ncbi:hypothetical protein [Catellatospora sichuanensis]|uniref:hypothetical protein n=1 Tax=Catellatospora sichuanensis TaxID=1969805 RepID=UPI00118309F5|nr:hypothetical protein [Catellatospora sichuanensis]